MTNATEASLRAALAGGGLVTFACDGEIGLGQTIEFLADTVLDASGHSITLSGSNTVRVLSVLTNISVSLVSVTIAAGVSTNGAGCFVQEGHLTLSNVCFTANIATNQDTSAPNGLYGGALFNQNGTIDAVGCTFSSNRVIQTAINGASCGGGAIYNSGGTVALDRCVFLRNSIAVNQAYPLPYPLSGCGSEGGAIYNSADLSIRSSTLVSNSVAGGPGYFVPAWPGGPRSEGPGGPGAGGALYNSGRLTVSSCAVVSNSAAGGAGPDGANASYMPGDGSAIGGLPGGLGGGGQGGAIYNSGIGTLVNCTVAGNIGLGGNGGKGGNGMQYYAHGVLITIDGTSGGDGGPGFGGIYCSNSASSGLALTNCTIAGNYGIGGTGGIGGMMLVQAPSGTNGSAEGGIHAGSSTTRMINVIFGSNGPGNVWGTPTDLGHNLSSDLSGPLTNSSSLVGVDPGLGPLAQDSGPTLSMALRPGSPAIDRGDNGSAPPVDQRGLPRPIGGVADIGAYEFGSPAYLQARLLTADNRVWVRAVGVPSQPFELQASTNLATWLSIVTNQLPSSGITEFYEPINQPNSFFRLLLR